MAITLTTGTLQTLSVPTRTPKAPAIGSYVYSTDDPGQSVYTNTGNALDQPNSIRYSITDVSDVFKNSKASPLASQRKDGRSYLVQINEVWKVNDSANTSFVPYYLPVSAHFVIKLPVDEQITSAQVAGLLDRLIGAICRNGTDALDVAANPLLHGITRL